jgi:hypothetical protein
MQMYFIAIELLLRMFFNYFIQLFSWRQLHFYRMNSTVLCSVFVLVRRPNQQKVNLGAII